MLGLSSAANAQSQLDWLTKQPAFNDVLQQHLHEVRQSTYPTVSALLLKPDADSLLVYLGAYTYLAEVQDHLPSSFTVAYGQGFLIYDGTETLIDDKNSWFETVRVFVGNRLCDDLRERELLKKPGPKEVRMPCTIIYDAPIRKITFVAGRLVKNEVVARIPYYTK